MHSLADRWPNLYYGYIIIIDVTPYSHNEKQKKYVQVTKEYMLQEISVLATCNLILTSFNALLKMMIHIGCS